MNRLSVLAILILFVACTVLPAAAQNSRNYRYVNGSWVLDDASKSPAKAGSTSARDAVEAAQGYADGVLALPDSTLDVSATMFIPYYYSPVIFDGYDINLTPDSIASNRPLPDPSSPSYWLATRLQTAERFRRFKQHYMVTYPNLVRYNINSLPEAPKRFIAKVDPTTERITVEEFTPTPAELKGEVGQLEVKKIHWLQKFAGSVQFSQAYISPNWYQGGNNNLNMIANIIYNVNLNKAFHPNLLFENTFQYKLGLNSAPDDSIRNYSISEDLLQINSKFGVKAAKRWYYSATLQFKTQLLNNYKTNTRDLKAAFLSPGELNLGLGMTYEYVSPKKSVKFNVSIAPLSYNLKTCIESRMDEKTFGIKEGHTTVSQYGSNIDSKLTWKMAYNIDLVSHLTAFTDYNYIQADWENTISFAINKFLSTQLYVHLRYDTQTPGSIDYRWHKLQLKEILSFGFAYTVGTL